VRILYSEDEKLQLYTDNTIGWLAAPETSIKYLSKHVHPAEAGSMAQLTRLELQNYMAHTLLRDTDVMSMAHSLEVRVPLIDHKLVEFAARLPADMKLRNGQGKWALIQALSDVLPPEVLERPKQGFEMPVAAWMRNDLKDVLDDVFSERSVQERGLFKADGMSTIYQNFLDGNGPYMRVWALATLELWMRSFIDGREIS
jgi:asparagine synthase (glutamine-hydrolysing)